MRLRTTLRRPLRYENEEEHISMPKAKKITKPEFPELLKQQIVPFNESGPAAAFPSLPLTTTVGPKQTAGSRRPFSTKPGRAVAAAVASLNHVDQSRFTGTVDFRYSNDLLSQPESVGDEGDDGDDGDSDGVELSLKNGDKVVWSSLDLSIQYQIFRNLCLEYPAQVTGQKLCLSNDEYDQIRYDVKLRQQNPLSYDDIWRVLQDETGGYAGSQMLRQFSEHLAFALKYEEAGSFQIQRGTQFLQQLELGPNLLGSWTRRADGYYKVDTATFSDSGYASASETLGDDRRASLNGAYQQYEATAAWESEKTYRELSINTVEARPAKREHQRKQTPQKLVLIAQVQPEGLIQARLPTANPQGQTEGDTGDRHTISKPQPHNRNKQLTVQRPAAIQVATTLSPTIATSSSVDQGGGGQRSAGSISLRARHELRPTKAAVDWQRFDEFFSDEIAGVSSKGFKTVVPSNPSSAFVSLQFAHQLATNERTGRAELSSSPIVRQVDGAATALATAREHPHTPVAKSSPAFPDLIRLIDDCEIKTDLFKKLPQEEQERLLSIHPAKRGLEQMWIMYGSVAWDKNRLWNTKFPGSETNRPEPGAAWNVEAAGSILGMSIINQFNLCQRLGLGLDFFTSARIGEDIIDAYGSMATWRSVIKKEIEQLSLASANSPSRSVLNAPNSTNAQKRYLAVRDSVWHKIKAKYETRLDKTGRQQLKNMGSPGLILFDMDNAPAPPIRRPVQQPALTATTSDRPLVKSTENPFTSKALEELESEGRVPVTPSTGDLGVFAQNSSERGGYHDALEFRPRFDSSPIGDRDIVNGDERAAVDNDVEMADADSHLRSDGIIFQSVENDTSAHFGAPTAQDNTSTSVRQAINKGHAFDSPSFSPISPITSAEAEAIMNDRDEQGRKAARLLFQLTGATPTLTPPSTQSTVRGEATVVPRTVGPSSDVPHTAIEARELPQHPSHVPIDKGSGEQPSRKGKPCIKLHINTGIENNSKASTPHATEQGRRLSRTPASVTITTKGRKAKEAATTHSTRESTPASSTRSRTSFRESTPADGLRSRTSGRESTPAESALKMFQPQDKPLAAPLLQDVLKKKAAMKVEQESKAKQETRPKAKKKVKLEAEEEGGDGHLTVTPTPTAKKRKATPKSSATTKDDTPATVQSTPKPKGGPKMGAKRGPYKTKKVREEEARRRAEEEQAARDYAMMAGNAA